MKTIAATVREEISKHVPRAVTLEYGYLINGCNDTFYFPKPSKCVHTRRPDGRCTRAVATYADGSILVYTYTDRNGPRYSVKTG